MGTDLLLTDNSAKAKSSCEQVSKLPSHGDEVLLERNHFSKDVKESLFITSDYNLYGPHKDLCSCTENQTYRAQVGCHAILIPMKMADVCVFLTSSWTQTASQKQEHQF